MDKTKRLADITDEVKELHPVLKKLLPRLPNVGQVEYTHGATEQGADFVLEKKDPTLGVSNFVGVIVKINSINAGEVAKATTQIEECAIERTFENGKKKIRLNEVWIVTSGSISSNAKDLINAKYADRSIRFIDRDHLITLLDHHFPAFWTELDVTVGDYLTNVYAEVNELEKSMTLLPDLEPDFYVQQNLFRSKDVSDFQRGRTRVKPTRVSLRTETKTHRLVLIEAEAGAGKSKLLRQTARELTEAKVFIQDSIVPVLLRASDIFRDSKADLATLVRSKLGVNSSLIDNPKNKLLVFVDGADEVRHGPGGISAALDRLAPWVAENNSHHLVVSSRFLDFAEPEATTLGKWHRLQLHPLTNAQLFQFVKHLCKNLKESNRLFEDIKESAIFRELPKSPIAALLLTQYISTWD